MSDTGNGNEEVTYASPPLVAGGLFSDPNWTPRLADRLGSVVTDGGGVSEHWPRDIAPVFYPHLPNPFWIEVPPAGDVPPDEVIPAPTITDVSPNGGTRNGGTGVTITGTGFIGVDPVAGVMFGTYPATGVILDTPTQLTCLSPSTFPQRLTVDVSVTGVGGTGTLSNAYTFNGPTQFQAQSVQEQPESVQEQAPIPPDPNIQTVAQTIQENAETIGEAAQNIGEAAQALTEPSKPSEATSPTPEAPSGSVGTTEATPGSEEIAEWELDQYWGIEPEPTPEPAPEPEDEP